MAAHIGAVTLLVREYDEAIDWFRTRLGFTLIMDGDMGAGKRWVLMSPPGAHEARLLLARAVNDDQRAAIGNQTGGRVFLFLHTDDFDRDHTAMLQAGVSFLEQPRDEPYGRVAVFQDLYGNRWDLLQLN
jgi:catechol 2,3-dioxygenase-like lactoylglutathione lyase family enzyme